MDDRNRKLGIAALAVALFGGFVALTEWTGDEPGSVEAMGEQEQSDLQQFCFVFSSSFVPYELVLRAASGMAVSSQEASELGILDSTAAQSLAESQINMLADQVPDDYGADARRAAEGLERALDGDLDADEVEEYVASFEALQERAEDDCDAVDGVGGGDRFGGGGFRDFEELDDVEEGEPFLDVDRNGLDDRVDQDGDGSVDDRWDQDGDGLVDSRLDVDGDGVPDLVEDGGSVGPAPETIPGSGPTTVAP